jgi:hypothetical protein
MHSINVFIVLLAAVGVGFGLYLLFLYNSGPASGDHRGTSRLLDYKANSNHSRWRAKLEADASQERARLNYSLFVEKQTLRLLATEDDEFDRLHSLLEMQYGRQVADHITYLLTQKNVRDALEYASKRGIRLPHSEELDRLLLGSSTGEKIIDTEVRRLNSATDIEHQKQDFEARFQANARLKEWEDQRRKSFFGDDDEEQ